VNITCPGCSTVFEVDDAKLPPPGAKMRCKVCSNVFVWDGAGQKAIAGRTWKILIANDDSAVHIAFKDALAATSAEMLSAYDGVEAMKIVEEVKPDVAVLDVALSKLYGFEVCSHIKENAHLSSRIKVILMTAVYDKTRYKRNPASLYGADDYIERHHIHDMFISKLENLLGSSISGAAAPAPMPTSYEPDKYADALQNSTQPIDPNADDVTVRARKLARIIVSDIVLYNNDAVEEGIKGGNLYNLLMDDIKDGIKYFKKRLSTPEIRPESYLKEAFEEFIAAKKREYGISS